MTSHNSRVDSNAHARSGPLLPGNIPNSNDETGSNHQDPFSPPGFQTFGSDNNWGSADDAHPPTPASPTVTGNNAMDPPGIASQEIDTLDSDGSEDARTHSPLPLQSVAHSESPQPISNSDVDSGLDYKPSTPVPEDLAAPTSAFHTHSSKHDWGSKSDALGRFLHRSKHLSDDAHPPTPASPSVTGNNAMDPPEIASQEIDTLDSDGSGDAGILSPLPLQLVANPESPPHSTSTSNSDDDGGGSDYAPSIHKPLLKPSTPVPENRHLLPRLSSSKEELYIGAP
jgi:hypothetical protein